jgi:cytochrome c-type biogenesis protein CcmE
MAEATITAPQTAAKPAFRMKFIVGGAVLLAAVVYLIVTNLILRQEYYTTVNELTEPANNAKYVGKDARVIGVVLGDTIEYDGKTLKFVIANVPDSAAEIEDEGGLAEILHNAASNPNAHKITVIVTDQPKPDLLKDEAQAIVSGKLGADGTFYATELLLKCPTRYQQGAPQASNN